MTDDRVAALSAVLDRHREDVRALPGVVGTGVGTSTRGEPAIHVFVRSDADADVERRAAALLEGMPLEIVVVGDVTAANVEEGENDGES